MAVIVKEQGNGEHSEVAPARRRQRRRVQPAAPACLPPRIPTVLELARVAPG